LDCTKQHFSRYMHIRIHPGNVGHLGVGKHFPFSIADKETLGKWSAIRPRVFHFQSRNGVWMMVADTGQSNLFKDIEISQDSHPMKDPAPDQNRTDTL